VATEEGCDFCEIVRREEPAREALRTEHIVAFCPDEPATLGHTLLIPRQHLINVWDLDRTTASYLTSATLDLAHAVRLAVAPEGLNIIQSNGEAATQSVFHLHVHLVPRWTGDGMGRIWPEETNWSEKQKATAQDEIRAALRRATEPGRT
jgi:histidine triad (HIT) family protein